jgi:D-xylonolactonase
MEIELIADYACVVGEGVIWHPTERRVYWVDIPAGRLFRYDPATGRHEQMIEGEPIGGVTVQADGALLLFRARGAVQLWRDGALTTVVDEIPADRDSRFNDVIADPAGRVFCGTMASESHAGRLYRLDPDGRLTVVLEDIQVPNGLGFTPDRRGLYFTDTMRRVINLFDYDEATGELTNQRVFARAPEEAGEGLPDGMTVDREGDVWSARWDGGCLVRYAPDGREIGRIAFPARKVASAAFGGDDYGDLYVITAGGDQKATDGAGAGALFRLRPGATGVPEFASRVGL